MNKGLDNLKQRFALQLALSLRSAYGGTLPSLSTIARDLSLRFPYLPHVSTETVRKWLRGVAIPQSPRMQALATWLGDDLLQVLNTKQQPVAQSNHQRNSFAGQIGDISADGSKISNIVSLLDLLSENDQALVVQLVESLATKSHIGKPGGESAALKIDTEIHPTVDESGHRVPDTNQAGIKRRNGTGNGQLT